MFMSDSAIRAREIAEVLRKSMINPEFKEFFQLFLERIFDTKISSMEYFDRQDKENWIHLHGLCYDIMLETCDGKIGVEVNFSPYDAISPRNVHLLHSEHFYQLADKNYGKDIKYNQINFVSGLLFYKNKPLADTGSKERFHMFQLLSHGKDNYVNNFYIYQVNVDFFVKGWDLIGKDMLDKKLIYMLDMNEKSFEKLSNKDIILSQFKKILSDFI